jgi:hypothetical protein
MTKKASGRTHHGPGILEVVEGEVQHRQRVLGALEEPEVWEGQKRMGEWV